MNLSPYLPVLPTFTFKDVCLPWFAIFDRQGLSLFLKALQILSITVALLGCALVCIDGLGLNVIGFQL
jgi:hypothetical protein